jgi:hypothetical protein
MSHRSNHGCAVPPHGVPLRRTLRAGWASARSIASRVATQALLAGLFLHPAAGQSDGPLCTAWDARRDGRHASGATASNAPGIQKLDEYCSGRIEVLDAYVAARIEDLARRAPALGAALERARYGSIRVVIGTPEQVRSAVGADPWLSGGSGAGQLADFFIYKDDPGGLAVRLIVVRVHVERIRRTVHASAPLGLGRRRATRQVDALTDAVLIHELWGHLVPILEAGDHSGNCPDPLPGEVDSESCVMKRENGLRRDLGLAERREYALRLR